MDNNMNECLFGCIGYAYVPVQTLNKVSTPEKALEDASLFPELVMTMKEYGEVCTQCGGVE